MSFRREAYVPRGGPDGGDGGKGGDVVVVADSSLHTLLDCQYQQLYRAKNGFPGMGSNKQGRSAPDLEIRVPIGTQIYDNITGEMLFDLDTEGDSRVVAKGGDGGRGNARFATSRNQAPRRREDGWPGVERELRLELKLIADVGLVGLPNSGKSTLISNVSNARPKIADYPFTTKVPALGVVKVKGRSFVMADIPGLIEGAHLGAGMGDRFLRHVERTKVLLHLIDPSPLVEPSPEARFEVIMNELASYAQDMTKRPMLAVITKMDITENEEPADDLKAVLEKKGLETFKISAITGAGVKELLNRVTVILSKYNSES
jgi:GTPase